MNMVGLPPGMIITSSGDTFDLEALVQVGGDRLAQRRDAVRRRVAVMAVADRLDGGFLDVLGRLEVGLADAEVDDVAALRGERVRARQHREGVLLADAVEVRHGFQHGVSSVSCHSGVRSQREPGVHDHRRSKIAPAVIVGTGSRGCAAWPG